MKKKIILKLPITKTKLLKFSISILLDHLSYTKVVITTKPKLEIPLSLEQRQNILVSLDLDLSAVQIPA